MKKKENKKHELSKRIVELITTSTDSANRFLKLIYNRPINLKNKRNKIDQKTKVDIAKYYYKKVSSWDGQQYTKEYLQCVYGISSKKMNEILSDKKILKIIDK